MSPAQLGTVGYLRETPECRTYSEYWDLVWNDKLISAMDFARESGMDQFDIDLGSWFTRYAGRADYLTHWGGAFKYATSLLGLPIGDYPHSRHRRRCCQRRGERRFARPINASVWSANSAANRLRKTLLIGVQYGNTSSWKPLLRRFAG